MPSYVTDSAADVTFWSISTENWMAIGLLVSLTRLPSCGVNEITEGVASVLTVTGATGWSVAPAESVPPPAMLTTYVVSVSSEALGVSVKTWEAASVGSSPTIEKSTCGLMPRRRTTVLNLTGRVKVI